ncbi:ABC transporter permease [Streptomyces sp. NPDC087440]|uniref:ABC transporter permease n=1 Tax=Streptomyces sp. NPDC087440 TaxID=3365790 RepID=UPI00382B19C7
MTATLHTTALTTPTTPRPRFSDLLAAEWLKLWSLRATRWAFPATALIIVGIGVNGALADYRNFPQYPEGIRENFVPTWALRDAFPLASAMVLMLIVGTLGALSVVNEYASGLIRTTTAAVPARRSLLAAKALVMTGVTAVFGVAVVAASFAVTQAILSGRNVGLSFGDPEVLASLAASAALAPMSALVGLGLGVLLRHGAATVAVTALVLVLLPSFVGQEEAWTAAIKFALPLNAWQNLATVAPLHVPPPHTPSLTHSWVVLAVWPLLATAVALALVRRRDL